MPRSHQAQSRPGTAQGRALWRQLSARYEGLVVRIVPQAQAFFDMCLSFVPQGQLSILELGSGTGFATERLLRLNRQARITALDFSADMLAIARAKSSLKTVQFLQGDIRAEWPTGRFDVIFTTLCLHHLTPAERREVLHRAWDRLRRHGRFINGDIFKPPTVWEERLLRERWRNHLSSRGLCRHEAAEMLAKRRRNLRNFDTLDAHRAALAAAGFRRILCPWVCEMAAVWVGFKG